MYNYHNKHLKMKQIFYKYFLFSCCFLSLCILFWFRFLRKKLPRDIPFELDLLKTISLLIICVLLIYNLSKLIKKKKKINILSIISNNIQTNLENIDQEFKQLPVFKKFYEKNSLKFIKYLLQHYYILYLIDIVCKMIILIFFIIDIYNKQLWFTYKFIWLYILIYLVKYIKFSLLLLKNNRLTYINRCASLSPINPNILTIDNLIIAQTNNIIKNKSVINYIIILNQKYIQQLYLQLSLKEGQIIDGARLTKSIRGIITFVTQINTILVLDNNLQNKYKIIFVIFLSFYAISWCYIFFSSISTFAISENDLLFFISFKDNCDPFSNIILSTNVEFD